VVWTPPPPLPTASHFAELQNVYAVPYLKPEGRQGYLAFLNDPKPRAFVIAPDGGVGIGPRQLPDRPLRPRGVQQAASGLRHLRHQRCRGLALRWTGAQGSPFPV
jgi:hypothetical protein